MLKKSVLFVCAALMFVPATFAAVVSDCETGLDGWVGRDWETPGSVVSVGTVGVTSGAQSLMIAEGGAGWKISAMLKFQLVLDPNTFTGLKAVRANWLASKYLECDITVDAQASADPNAWLNVELLSNSQNGGWYGFSNAEKSDDINPAFPGSWQPQNQTGPVTHHVKYDLAAVNAKMQAAGGPGDWFEIFVIVNNAGFASGGNIYIDNVKLTGAPKIVYVTDAPDVDANGAMDDQGWIDWLQSTGYEIDARRNYWKEPLDVNRIAELETADLIIASRGLLTSNYDNVGEAAKWNALTKPLISLNVWMVRNNSNRWFWVNSVGTIKNNGSPLMMVSDATHPIFAGVSIDADGLIDVLDPNVGEGHTSFYDNTLLDGGNGKVLSTCMGAVAQSPWIIEWPAGVEFYTGAGQTTGGKRMLFSAGTQDKVVLTASPQGAFNLTATGQRLMLNAIQYLAPLPIALVNASFDDPNTEKIKGWNGEGVGGTPAVDIPGWASDGVVVDSGIETGWTATDGAWTAFVKQEDPMVYQVTSYIIQAGDMFKLTVDGRNTWQATTLLMVIGYVDETGAVIPVGFEEMTLADGMQTFSMMFAADTDPTCLGKKLVVAFANSTTRADASAWLGLDNVRLAVMKTK